MPTARRPTSLSPGRILRAAHDRAMQRAVVATLAAFLSLALHPARAEIFRCTSPAGAVTYQQDPCDAMERGKKIDVPASYPTPDSAERERLLAREAALDRRLEAERDRWNREALAQAMQPAPAPAPEASDVPEVVWVGAPIGFHHHPFHRPHPFARRGATPRGPVHN